MTDFQQKAKVQAWRGENTRDSKKKATGLVNGAWRAELFKLYSRPKLALLCIRYPPAMVNTLLKRWQEYMASDKYKQERDRASRDRTDDNKMDEVLARVKVYQL